MASGAPQLPDPWWVLRGHGAPVTAVTFCDLTASPTGDTPGPDVGPGPGPDRAGRPDDDAAGSFGASASASASSDSDVAATDRAARPLVPIEWGTAALLSGDAVGEIRLWNLGLKRSSLTARVAHAAKGILAIHLLRGAQLAVQGREGSLGVMQLEPAGTIRELRVCQAGGMSFCASAVIPATEVDRGGPVLAIPAFEPSELNLFDVRTSETVGLLRPPAELGPMGMCMCLKPVPGSGGLQLAAGYENGMALVWDLSQRTVLRHAKPHDDPLTALDLDRTGVLGVSAGASEMMHIGPVGGDDDGAAKELLGRKAKPRAVSVRHRGINSVSIRDDGQLFATAGWDHRVRLFSWPKAKPLAILDHHRLPVNVVAWSGRLSVADGGFLLATASKDTRISLWSLYN